MDNAKRRLEKERPEECGLQDSAMTLNGCDFVICDSCQWTATVFRTHEGRLLIDECPSCRVGSFLSIIPLAKNEAYRFTMDQTRGLDVEFRTIF